MNSLLLITPLPVLGKHLTADMCWQEEQAAHPEGWNRSFFWLIPCLQAGKEGGSILHLFIFVFPNVSSSGAALGALSPQKPKFLSLGCPAKLPGMGGLLLLLVNSSLVSGEVGR